MPDPRDMSVIVPMGGGVEGSRSIYVSDDENIVPMTQFMQIDTWGRSDVEPAPPQNARQAVDTGRCQFNDTCKNRKASGYEFCGSHRRMLKMQAMREHEHDDPTGD